MHFCPIIQKSIEKIKCQNKLLDKKQVSVRRLYDWNKLLPENYDGPRQNGNFWPEIALKKP